MATINEKQLAAWQWHTSEEVAGILEDTAGNVNPANYRRKVETFHVVRAAGFNDVVDIYLNRFITNLIALPNGGDAEIRAIILNLMSASLGQDHTYARLAESNATR